MYEWVLGDQHGCDGTKVHPVELYANNKIYTEGKLVLAFKKNSSEMDGSILSYQQTQHVL